MYCSNCGKEWKDGDIFCGGCGKSREQIQHEEVDQKVQTINQSQLPHQVAKKKGLPVWAIILIILGSLAIVGVVVVLFLSLFFVNVINENESYIYEQTSDNVYLDGEEIHSVYYFFGEYELCETPYYQYNEGNEVIDYSYCDESFDEELINSYLDYLIELDDFEEYEQTSMIRSVRKPSNEKGYYIVVRAYIYGERIEYYKEEERIYNEDNSM